MPIGLAQVITAVVILGIVLAIAIPVIRLRGWPVGQGPGDLDIVTAPEGDIAPAAVPTGPLTVRQAAAYAEPTFRRPARPMLPVRIHVAWVALAPIGIVVAIVGLFLQANTPPFSFSHVEHNTLLQIVSPVFLISGFISLAAGVVQIFAAYRSGMRPSPRIIIYPIWVTILAATLLRGNKLSSTVDSKISLHASAGLGVYVVLAGLVIVCLAHFAVLLSPEVKPAAPAVRDSSGD